jgi:hypothetical protein
MDCSALPFVRGVYGFERIGLRSRSLQALRQAPDRLAEPFFEKTRRQVMPAALTSRQPEPESR